MSKSTATAVKWMHFDDYVDELVESFSNQQPKRTGSLLISVFGDAIAPHGGSVWLGSLVKALEPFGVNDRLVRTSVFRLTKDGWLRSEQIGRRSFYSLTEKGQKQIHAASRQIYREPRRSWDGNWSLVELSGIETSERDKARKRLQWLGFAAFSNNLMAHPAPDKSAVMDELQKISGYQQILFMQASVDDTRQDYLRELVQKAWVLNELDERYAQFLEKFSPVYHATRGTGNLDSKRAFQLRTLLIHEYRKILLRDPFLPHALLPGNWNGVAAYQLCRNLYILVAGPVARFLQENWESADGAFPPAEPGFFQRFDGIKQ